MNDKHDMPRLNPRRKVAMACSVLFGTCLKLTAPTMLAVAQAAGVSMRDGFAGAAQRPSHHPSSA